MAEDRGLRLAGGCVLILWVLVFGGHALFTSFLSAFASLFFILVIIYKMRMHEIFLPLLLSRFFSRKLGVGVSFRAVTCRILNALRLDAAELICSGVIIDNPPNYSTCPICKIRTIEIIFDPVSLFTRCINLQSVLFEGMEINLERKNGMNNTKALKVIYDARNKAKAVTDMLNMKSEDIVSDSEYSDVSEEDGQVDDGASSPSELANDRSLGKFVTEKAQVAAAAATAAAAVLKRNKALSVAKSALSATLPLLNKTSKEDEAGKDANTEVKRKELVKSLKRLISRLSGSSSLDPAEEETTKTSEETLRLSEEEVTPLSAKALREQLEELGVELEDLEMFEELWTSDTVSGEAANESAGGDDSALSFRSNSYSLARASKGLVGGIARGVSEKLRRRRGSSRSLQQREEEEDLTKHKVQLGLPTAEELRNFEGPQAVSSSPAVGTEQSTGGETSWKSLFSPKLKSWRRRKGAEGSSMGESLVSDASSLPEDRDAYSPDQSPVKRRAEVAAGAGAVAAAVAVEVPSAVILRSNSSREGHELMESPRMFGEGTRVNKPEGRANSLLYRKKINVSRSNSETGYKEGSRQILYCVHGVTFRHLKMHVSAMLKELEGAGNSPKIVTAGEPAGLDGDLISSSDAISSSRPMAESERADALKPLALDLLTLHAEDFKPSTNAQRRDGIPANEVARRIKARLKQEIRKQNRGKLLGMGAGVGLRWLRRKVRNYQRKNPAEEQS